MARPADTLDRCSTIRAPPTLVRQGHAFEGRKRLARPRPGRRRRLLRSRGWRAGGPSDSQARWTTGSNSCTKAWRSVMPAGPRIRRAVVDEADVYRPVQGIPVVASMEYPASGTREDVEGLAIAWTRGCVEVMWWWRGEHQADWIEARCVKRR